MLHTRGDVVADADGKPVRLVGSCWDVTDRLEATERLEIIAGVARGSANPDLQLRAIRYIGIMGGQDNRQILSDVYKSSNDSAVCAGARQ